MSKHDSVLFVLLVATALLLAAGYTLSSTPVTISIDGASRVVRTHSITVADLFDELGVVPAPLDIVSLPLTATLGAGDVISITRARHVILHVDGRRTAWLTHAATAADALHEAGVQLHERDLVFVNDQPVAVSAPLLSRPAAGAPAATLAHMAPAAAALPAGTALTDAAAGAPQATIVVRRAAAITIIDGGVSARVVTTAGVVGEALFGEGVYIYAADIVSPTLDTRIADGLTVQIRRAKPATITADGRTFSTRTQADTVAAMLIQEGVAPSGKDYATPSLEAAVTPGLVVHLTRVREETITESEGIPFQTVWQADPSLELDQQRIITHGKQGVRKRSIRIVYENGQEVQRTMDREWVDEEPRTQVLGYGTRVVVRTLMTPDGPIEYWREIRAWATFYTPLLSGTPLNAPWFGITRTGKRATKGVIAVDPDVIRLHTPMYVPGYGFGAAEDTGGMIIGKIVDLCYDDDDSHPERWNWARWTSVYLLTPVPSDIPWVLPDFPQERR